MVRILGFHCCGPGSIPGWGTEIPQASGEAKKKKKNDILEHILTEINIMEVGIKGEMER